jgi:hypothetical protein
MSLKLKKFDTNTIFKTAPLIFIVGKRDTGKSFLIRDLYRQGITLGTVISTGESYKKFYEKINPNLNVHEIYNPEIIKKIIDNQEIMLKQNLMCYNELLIMDHCIYDEDLFCNESISGLFFNHKHLNISSIISMQYPFDVPIKYRETIDYVFIFTENNLSNRRRIWENYASLFPTFESFCKTMDQLANIFDYNCLVIDNISKSDNIEDRVFWYKAKIYPDYEEQPQYILK